MIFALIPAAGESRRMGRPKLALPLGEKTVLEHVLDALRHAQVDHMLVVIGPHVAELLPIARDAGAHSRLPPPSRAPQSHPIPPAPRAVRSPTG